MIRCGTSLTASTPTDDTEFCSKCGVKPRTGTHRWCNDCQAARRRDRRRELRETVGGAEGDAEALNRALGEIATMQDRIDQQESRIGQLEGRVDDLEKAASGHAE